MSKKRISYDSDINKKLVGERIKAIRLSRGMTLEEFGERLGASKGAVYHWESGKNLPNKGRLETIAEMSNLTLKELLYGDEFLYVTSLIPTEDLKEKDLFYGVYVDEFGKNSYVSNEEIEALYEQVKFQISGINMTSSTINILVSAHVLRILNNRLQGDYRFKESFESDELFNEEGGINSRSQSHVETLIDGFDYEISKIADAASTVIKITDDSKELLAKHIKKSIDNYIKHGLIIDESSVDRYIKNKILGIYDKDDYFMGDKL